LESIARQAERKANEARAIRAQLESEAIAWT
jgi:hypothetical protein